MATLTVIILAKNEEQHMKDCIASAQFADEVLLIDDGSTDKTVEIAESMGARVVHHAMNGDWSQQRRFAVEEARSEWIFFLDADERISPELQREVQEVLAKDEKKAYWIERSNVFHHNKATHGVLRPDYVLRFMPKEGTNIEGFVHETISSTSCTSRCNSGEIRSSASRKKIHSDRASSTAKRRCWDQSPFIA